MHQSVNDPREAIGSDESLMALARSGDRAAFGQLWQRHAPSGIRVARQISSSIDADDLVSEAYVRIYQRVIAGGGPSGAFRPYLYTTIRNIASRVGNSERTVSVDDLDQMQDPKSGEEPISRALDGSLTVVAFQSLPERWQSVLWYTEVEGMTPQQVGPILGLTSNAISALSYRAREGLRTAWLQAHIANVARSADCRWAIERLGDYVRDGLSTSARTRIAKHLQGCTQCSVICGEVDDISSRLAVIMIPFLLGSVAGGTFFATLGTPSSAIAAGAAIAMPPAFGALGSVGMVGSPTVLAGLSAVSAPLLAGIAVALTLSGALVFGFSAIDRGTNPEASASGQLGRDSSAQGITPSTFNVRHGFGALDGRKAGTGRTATPGDNPSVRRESARASTVGPVADDEIDAFALARQLSGNSADFLLAPPFIRSPSAGGTFTSTPIFDGPFFTGPFFGQDPLSGISASGQFSLSDGSSDPGSGQSNPGHDASAGDPIGGGSANQETPDQGATTPTPHLPPISQHNGFTGVPASVISSGADLGKQIAAGVAASQNAARDATARAAEAVAAAGQIAQAQSAARSLHAQSANPQPAAPQPTAPQPTTSQPTAPQPVAPHTTVPQQAHTATGAVTAVVPPVDIPAATVPTVVVLPLQK